MKKFVFHALFALSFVAVPALAAPSLESTDMEYVDICGRDGSCKKFSRLIMGTDHLAQSNWTHDGQPEANDAELANILDEAAAMGINFFDTAPIYVGGIENRLGKWIQSRRQMVRANDFYYNPSSNPDRELYSLSKGGFPFDLFYSKHLEAGSHSRELKQALKDQGFLDRNADIASEQGFNLQNPPPGSYSSRLFGSVAQIVFRVASEMAHSLTNLNNDITIYLMHRDDGDYIRFKEVARPKVPVATIMEALSDPQIANRHWGLGWSNWNTERVNESVSLAAQSNHFNKPLMNSPYFSLFEMSQSSIHAGGVQVTHAEMMNPNFQKGIKLSPYSPLGGFSFLDKPEPRWENAKRAAKEKFDAGDAYWQNVYHSIFTDANKARYDRVVAFTEAFNRKHQSAYTLDQMINAYALAHPRTDFLTVGPITVEQLKRTVGSLELSRKLSAEDLEYLYSGR